MPAKKSGRLASAAAAAAVNKPASAASARRPPNIAGIGRICTWQGGSLWIGREAGRALPHAHHAIQITLALEGASQPLLRRAGECWTAYAAALVKPHLRHEFDGCGAAIAHVFVEPETLQGRALLARFAGPGIAAPPLEPTGDAVQRLAAGYSARADDATLIDITRGIIGGLTGPLPAPAAASARIERAAEFVSARLAAGVSLADAAASVHLSPSRFRHLFVRETGTTFRGYVLWLRINRAVAAMVGGASWTDAAHHAGFADSAHLTRTFRRIFGINPTMLVRDVPPAGR